MKAFAELYARLDETNKTSGKVAAMSEYFSRAAAADAAWAIYFLCGRKIRQLISSRNLRQWSAEAAGVPEWLFDECYEAVGDAAETMALVLPPASSRTTASLAVWVEQKLLALREAPEAEQRTRLREYWAELDDAQRLVLHKLLTGAFRVGVSQGLVIRALADSSGLEPDVVAHRLMGDWDPSAEFFRRVITPDITDTLVSRPYPFFLAHPLEAPLPDLGAIDAWQAEWKWDGIRAQVIRRDGQVFIWSRGEELMTDRFPELLAEANDLADGTVLDGEILAWRGESVLPFAVLQKRIGRKSLGRRILSEAPVRFMAFDLLECGGEDIRSQPLNHRRQKLENLGFAELDAKLGSALQLSPLLVADSWKQLEIRREESRQRGTEGLMLKRRDSFYGVGRTKGDWWKWKVDPYTVDAVLVYAQRGSGRRASLYTDYTFAVWEGDELVPFAKAYSGLDDAEIREVDAFVRRHTLERFGPVRRIRPELVFELAFENIQVSSRHKSGLAVRFPRIVRWRRDKTPPEADSLDTIRSLLDSSVPAGPGPG